MKKGENYIGTCVVFYCHDGCGNVLLNKRSENCRDEQGTWDPGGGAIEFGDTAHDTLRKEILEEYRTEIIWYEFLGFRDVHRTSTSGIKTHWIALDFKVHINREKVCIGEPHKCVALEWFTLDTLPSPLHSQFPTFISLYKDRLLKDCS